MMYGMGHGPMGHGPLGHGPMGRGPMGHGPMMGRGFGGPRPHGHRPPPPPMFFFGHRHHRPYYGGGCLPGCGCLGCLPAALGVIAVFVLAAAVFGF